MTNRIFTYILFLFLSLSLVTYAQDFKSQKRELENKLAELKEQKENIKAGITSLRDSIVQAEQDIEDCKLATLKIKYNDEDAQRIYMGKIWKGMSTEMMRDSWGEPDQKDVNQQEWGVFEQWYYGDIIYFFRDGVLFDWEEGAE